MFFVFYRFKFLEITWLKNLAAMFTKRTIAHMVLCLPSPTLHIQVKTLHEGVALGLIKPCKPKAHQQARHAHEGDDSRWGFLPGQAQGAIANAHTGRMGLKLPKIVANGLWQPPKPLDFGAAHVALKALGIKRLHKWSPTVAG